MYYLYVISSINRKYIYVGITNNIKLRISYYNLGYNRTTRPYKPFKLIHKETYPTRLEARNKEKYYKSGVGKEFLKKLK